MAVTTCEAIQLQVAIAHHADDMPHVCTLTVQALASLRDQTGKW